MNWKRSKLMKPSIHYEKLGKSYSSCRDEKVPKGYIPLMVGDEEEERFVVHVRLLKDASISCLLERAAQEFGYDQQGILKIPCDIQRFRSIVDEISKAT